MTNLDLSIWGPAVLCSLCYSVDSCSKMDWKELIFSQFWLIVVQENICKRKEIEIFPLYPLPASF
jgi:hypothetical protein